MIKDPTTRKILNRGWIPIRYHMEFGKADNPTYSAHHHGALIARLPNGGAKVWLVGEERTRNLTAADMRFVKELTA